MTAAVWKLCPTMFLDTEGHQMGIKYSMEGFVKHLILNMVGNSKRGFSVGLQQTIILVIDYSSDY